MCRAIANGNRRCPYHDNPLIMGVASAKTSAHRWERRLEASEKADDDAQMSRCIRGLGDAMDRLAHRQQQRVGTPVAPVSKWSDTAPLPPPAPSAAGAWDAERVEAMTWDELADAYGSLGHDPDAQMRVLELMEAREATYAQYEAAIEQTNGNLVNAEGRAAGVDELSLFSGPVSRAKKYGTAELQTYFAQHGRQTLAAFRFGMFGWSSDRKAATRAQQEGFADVAHV